MSRFSRRTVLFTLVNSLIVLGITLTLSAQGPGGNAKAKGKAFKGKQLVPRPGLVLREIWIQTPKGGETPATQANVWNPNLELMLYGEDVTATTPEAGMKITGNRNDANPIHTWTGLCPSSCGFTLKDKGNMFDLSGLGRITMNVKTSGLHQVRPMVKLADGTMLVAEEGAGTFTDWAVHNWVLGDQRWLQVDPEKMVTKGQWITNPDLSKVDEIGFVDLMPGSGHGAGGWSDVAEIEVYGKKVPR